MPVSATGSWNSWGSEIVENVLLYEGTNTLTLHIDNAGFNFSSFDFQFTGGHARRGARAVDVGQDPRPDNRSTHLQQAVGRDALRPQHGRLHILHRRVGVWVGGRRLDNQSDQSLVLALDTTLTATMLLRGVLHGVERGGAGRHLP